MDNFAKALRILRKTNHETQQDIADLLGVNKNTVSCYERGICLPSGPDALAKYRILADHYGIDMNTLIGSEMSQPLITPEEKEILSAYRKASRSRQYKVKHLLGIEEGIQHDYTEFSRNRIRD